MDQIGCNKCWPGDAELAWNGVSKLSVEDRLIDESHYSVSIRRCTSCSQGFLQICTETIDWQDGEDPIYYTVMPISEAERTQLQKGGPVLKADLRSVGAGRQALKHDWPKGEDPSTYWTTGVSIGQHD